MWLIYLKGWLLTREDALRHLVYDVYLLEHILESHSYGPPETCDPHSRTIRIRLRMVFVPCSTG